MNQKNISDAPDYQLIQNTYEQWNEFMKEKIEFSLTDSTDHTKPHCARVLLFALILGKQKGLSEDEMNALGMAAVFHDSRRLDDGIDKGHGRRAAEYYKDYCSKHDLPYDERTDYIMSYHDQDDLLGLSEIKKSDSLDERAILLYQIFKDADALDRFRFGPDAIDVKFLRTKEAHQLLNFAKELKR